MLQSLIMWSKFDKKMDLIYLIRSSKSRDITVHLANAAGSHEDGTALFTWLHRTT